MNLLHHSVDLFSADGANQAALSEVSGTVILVILPYFAFLHLGADTPADREVRS